MGMNDDRTNDHTDSTETAEDSPQSELSAMNRTLVFDKWDPSGVEVHDPGIQRYINLEPTASMHTSGKHAKRQFNKSDVFIVERLVNKVMRKEHNTGKKQKVYRIVKDAFDIIGERTKQNPIQVLVNAIENSGPREEIVRLKYGGIAVPRAVDTAPQRRVDSALALISKGVWKSTFKTKKTAAEVLASELTFASNGDMRSFAVSKKEEIERIAKAAR